MRLDPETWNTFLGWTGKKCFIPEGCNVPVEGFLLFGGILLISLAFVYLVEYEITHHDVTQWVKNRVKKWRE